MKGNFVLNANKKHPFTYNALKLIHPLRYLHPSHRPCTPTSLLLTSLRLPQSPSVCQPNITVLPEVPHCASLLIQGASSNGIVSPGNRVKIVALLERFLCML